MLKKIVFDLKIVTPIFMGGSDASQLADTIRVPSIRGQVRYWLRALLGQSYPDPEDLKKQEDALMGSTANGSPVWFRVQEPEPLIAVADRQMLPHRQVRGGNGLRREAFAEGHPFRLVLSPSPGRRTIPDEVLVAVLLWLYLGGIGKRTRRGFGSLQVMRVRGHKEAVSEKGWEMLGKRPSDIPALIECIQELLAWGLAKTSEFTHTVAPFPFLHEAVSNILLATPQYSNSDYPSAMVPFWTDVLRADGIRDERAFGFTDRNRRRSSPFHLHLTELQGKHHLVMTTFWAEPMRNEWQEKIGQLQHAYMKQLNGQHIWGRKVT